MFFFRVLAYDIRSWWWFFSIRSKHQSVFGIDRDWTPKSLIQPLEILSVKLIETTSLINVEKAIDISLEKKKKKNQKRKTKR